jgi:hypothetical protein|tara:strand:+ start:977 stop:1096 length:120 start_codon:yes stop_codon:yes gene_type:complete
VAPPKLSAQYKITTLEQVKANSEEERKVNTPETFNNMEV